MTSWTPLRTGHLCRRRLDGAHFSTIARELGIAKGSAIGKFHRLLRDRDALALSAEAETEEGTSVRVAEWMAAYGGSIADCARSMGISYDSARSAWSRVRRKMGAQAR